jgi:hypothetical protein
MIKLIRSEKFGETSCNWVMFKFTPLKDKLKQFYLFGIRYQYLAKLNG